MKERIILRAAVVLLSVTVIILAVRVLHYEQQEDVSINENTVEVTELADKVFEEYPEITKDVVVEKVPNVRWDVFISNDDVDATLFNQAAMAIDAYGITNRYDKAVVYDYYADDDTSGCLRVLFDGHYLASFLIGTGQQEAIIMRGSYIPDAEAIDWSKE